MKYDLRSIVHKAIHILEAVIGLILTIGVILAVIGLVITAHPMSLIEEPDHISHFLHVAATVVVTIEFINMLVTHSMSSVVEVLIMLIARQMIVSHGTATDNLIFCACVMLLFFIRKYLLTPHDGNHDHGSIIQHVSSLLHKSDHEADEEEMASSHH